jgi:membrane protein implicated in regulation of membrane protease activity
MIYGRRPRQLLITWGIALVLAGLIYWFEVTAPAFHMLLLPFYWIIAGVTVFLTWRWFRGRSRKDRRGADRRHADRRDNGPTSSE